MRQSSPYQATPLSKEGYRSLSISIPALVLEEKVGSLGSFYQLPLDNKSPQASLLADFIRNLFDGLALWPEQQIAQLGDQLVDLISLFMVSSQTKSGAKIHSQIGSVHLERAKRYIQRHCMDSNLQASQIAEACDISLSYLYRLFQMAEIGLADYIQSQRVLYSQSLLQNKNYDQYSLAEIARISGFSQASYFSRRFKLQVGMSPSTFRNK